VCERVYNTLQQNLIATGAQTADQPGLVSNMSCVVATPRFSASAHLLFLFVRSGSSEPALVAKVARVRGQSPIIEAEAANLEAVHKLCPGGFVSIPSVIKVGDCVGHRFLLETAIAGQPMRPSLVRRSPQTCVRIVLEWLLNLHAASLTDAVHNWYEELIAAPALEYCTCTGVNERGDVFDRVAQVAGPIASMPLRCVFEHGDLSHPNILINDEGLIGVVDWELGTPAGLPAFDLFFFLTYIAFCLGRPRTPDEHVAAFHKVFFTRDATWPADCILEYADKLRLPRELLRPLFLLGWSRYVWRLASRLRMRGHDLTRPEGWAVLTTDRYYSLWQHAIQHANSALPWAMP
jgi:aminoglycoside phosphotransferase